MVRSSDRAQVRKIEMGIKVVSFIAKVNFYKGEGFGIQFLSSLVGSCCKIYVISLFE